MPDLPTLIPNLVPILPVAPSEDPEGLELYAARRVCTLVRYPNGAEHRRCVWRVG